MAPADVRRKTINFNLLKPSRYHPNGSIRRMIRKIGWEPLFSDTSVLWQPCELDDSQRKMLIDFLYTYDSRCKLGFIGGERFFLTKQSVARIFGFPSHHGELKEVPLRGNTSFRCSLLKEDAQHTSGGMPLSCIQDPDVRNMLYVANTVFMANDKTMIKFGLLQAVSSSLGDHQTRFDWPAFMLRVIDGHLRHLQVRLLASDSCTLNVGLQLVAVLWPTTVTVPPAPPVEYVPVEVDAKGVEDGKPVEDVPVVEVNEPVEGDPMEVGKRFPVEGDRAHPVEVVDSVEIGQIFPVEGDRLKVHNPFPVEDDQVKVPVDVGEEKVPEGFPVEDELVNACEADPVCESFPMEVDEEADPMDYPETQVGPFEELLRLMKRTMTKIMILRSNGINEADMEQQQMDAMKIKLQNLIASSHTRNDPSTHRGDGTTRIQQEQLMLKVQLLEAENALHVQERDYLQKSNEGLEKELKQVLDAHKEKLHNLEVEISSLQVTLEAAISQVQEIQEKSNVLEAENEKLVRFFVDGKKAAALEAEHTKLKLRHQELLVKSRQLEDEWRDACIAVGQYQSENIRMRLKTRELELANEALTEELEYFRRKGDEPLVEDLKELGRKIDKFQELAKIL